MGKQRADQSTAHDSVMNSVSFALLWSKEQSMVQQYFAICSRTAPDERLPKALTKDCLCLIFHLSCLCEVSSIKGEWQEWILSKESKIMCS